jgi:ABC-type amino acid transport substrate-binding protein
MQIQKIDISRGDLAKLASRTLSVLTVSLVFTAAASAATLDRIKETGHIKLGYFEDARPFTQSPAPNNVQGYSANLCQKVVERVKWQLNLSQIAIDWVPVTIANHVTELKQGNIDLLCTPTSETAAKREDVSYSKPVFPGGVRAFVRQDTGAALRQALGDNPKPRPVWRGSPAAKVLDKSSFAVVAGTTTERWLAGKVAAFQIDAKVVAVPDYKTGLQQLMDGKVAVFFGDGAVAKGAVDLEVAARKLEVLPRQFTREPLSLALPRSDEDFRLLVDRALTESYADPKFEDMYAMWCGTMDDNIHAFFQWVSFAP